MRLHRLKAPVFATVSLLLAAGPAVSADELSNNKFGFGPSGSASAQPRAAGWVYRDCSYVTTTLTSTGFVVKVTNTDNSWVSAASKGSTPTVAQLMLLRACRETGASWGYYTTGSNWTTAVAY